MLSPEFAARLQNTLSRADAWALDMNGLGNVQSQASGGHAVQAGMVTRIPVRGVIVAGAAEDDYEVSADAVAKAIRAAADDPESTGTVLLIDSPGGMVRGRDVLREAVAYHQTKKKPIAASVEWQAASLAYMLAAATDGIEAQSTTATIGSIGTMLTLTDWSGLAEKLGIKPIVVASGPHKGTGVPGTKITEEQVEPLREIVNAEADEFRAFVAARRGMSAEEIATASTGRIWRAAEAIGMKLIDGIASEASSVAKVGSESRRRRMEGITALEQACPGADPAFLLSQLKANATPDAARKAWLDKRLADLDAREVSLKAREDAVTAKETELTAKAGKPAEEPKKAHGGTPVIADAAPGGTSGMTAREQFTRLVDERKAKGMTAADAVVSAAREHPEIHAAFRAEANR